MKARFVFVFALLVSGAALGGCAMRAPVRQQTPPQLPRTDTAKLLGEIGVLAAQQRTTNICPDACKLAEKICEAASKICDIAAEYREDSDLTDRCSNASVHCAVARRRCGECR